MTFARLSDLDRRWTDRLSVAEKPGAARTAAAILAHSGDSWFWLAAMALIWLFSDGRLRSWSLAMAAAIFATALLVMALKFTIRRRRPEGAWGAIYRRTDPHSFPSGHAARAVLIAVLFAGWGPAAVAPVIFLWAPLVVLARVAMGVHYLSDVLAGALLGFAAGLLALALFTP